MYLIFYDIQENRLRTKVVKLLQKEGYERLQYSVFVGEINPASSGLWERLQLLFAGKSAEKLYCLRVSKENLKMLKAIGTISENITYLCDGKSSLII